MGDARIGVPVPVPKNGAREVPRHRIEDREKVFRACDGVVAGGGFGEKLVKVGARHAEALAQNSERLAAGIAQNAARQFAADAADHGHRIDNFLGGIDAGGGKRALDHIHRHRLPVDASRTVTAFGEHKNIFHHCVIIAAAEYARI